jgi:hypothetical protein
VKIFFKSIILSFFYSIFHIVFLEGEDILPENLPENAKKVKFDRGDMHLEADRLTLENQLAHASGGVYFTGENFYARCGEVQCDIESQNMSALDIDMGIDRACISAEKVNFSRDQIEVENAQIGINLGLSGAIPNLRAKKITYDRNQKRGVARNTQLRIGKLPIMVLPYLSLGDWVRFMDVRLNAGHTSKLGGYFQSEVCYNIYEDLYLGMLLDVYAKRGALIGPILKIDSEGEAMVSHLKLKTGYISDCGERGEDVQGQPIGKNRRFMDMKQNHHFGKRIDLLSDFLWASDGRIEDDFKRLYEDYDVRDSFGEFDYRGESDLWTLFSRVKMNGYQDFTQQVPSLRFERFPREIFDSGIYYFGYIDFTRQKSRQKKIANPDQMEAIEVNRIDGYFGANRPMEWGDGAHITPLVGGKWTHYNGECDRFLGEVGLDFCANFYGLYPQQIPWLKAKEWKHVIRPVMKYRFISPSGKHTEKPIDGKRRNDFLPCIDLSEMRHVDDMAAQSVLRLGLENDFFAKDEKNRIRGIASLDFYQDFRFRRPYDEIDGKWQREESLSDFYIISELNPRRWLNLRLYSRCNWSHLSSQEVNAETNFISGDLWECGFRAKFLKHRIDQLSVNFCLHLNETSRLDFETQIEAKSGKILATEIGYATRLGGIWDAKLFFRIKNNSSRDGRFHSGFSINLMGW